MPSGTDPQDGSRRSWRLVRASKDAIPTSVRKFMRGSCQRRPAVAPWGSSPWASASSASSGWAIFASPVLGVRQVAVTGFLIGTRSRYGIAAVPHGTPLAQVDVDAVRARVAALPPVGQVQVSRRWPSTS